MKRGGQSTYSIDESKRYDLLIQSIKDYAIFMLTPEGNIASWNAGAERIKGYKAEEIIGAHFSVFYSQDAVNRKFPQYELAKAIEEGRFEDEGWRVRKDGTEFWANVIITPLYEDNKHVGFAKITRDITEKTKNEELTNKNKALLKINTDLDNFIYTASHDLKSPIVNLEGLINLLTKKVEGKLNKAEVKILQMMHVSIFKLKQTIDDLKEITIVQKDLENKTEVVSFKEVLEEVKADIAPMNHEAQPEFIEDFAVEHMSYAWTNLKTIFYNLLTNSIKYRSFERRLKIHIASAHADDKIVLSVTDNGLGLSKSQVPKLFGMFKRFHSHAEGTGIGLYIIKRIVENSGGKITVKSTENKGTTFKLFFPQAAADIT